MGQCCNSTANTEQKHQTGDKLTWMKSASSGDKPPKYVMVEVRHENKQNINGYYRNFSMEYPTLSAMKNCGENNPVYMRVTDYYGHPIQTQSVHYMYSNEFNNSTKRWIIVEYNALRKETDGKFVLSDNT